MSGNKPAARLLEELTRGGDTLPPYNAKAVQDIISEMMAMSDDLQEVFVRASEGDAAGEPLRLEAAASAMVYRATIARNKRCLLAYHMHRADHLELQMWAQGETLSADQLAKMSSEEAEYVRAYSELLAKYQDAESADMRTDLRPPKYDKVQVRALADCGEVMLGRGSSRVVRPGDILLMSRTDAEPYIMRGHMKEMPWEN